MSLLASLASIVKAGQPTRQELVVLRLLSLFPAGAPQRKLADTLDEDHLNLLPFGALYPTLLRLRLLGYIKTNQVEGRKHWQLSADGWLAIKDSPVHKYYRQERSARKPANMTISSNVPSKWRFLDLEEKVMWYWDVDRGGFYSRKDEAQWVADHVGDLLAIEAERLEKNKA